MASTKRPRSEDGLELDETRCTFWLQKKKRHCTQLRHAGTAFCCHHLREDGELARMQCPIDGSHTIFVSERDRHVKVCPAKLQQDMLKTMSWYKQGCNLGSASTSEHDALRAFRSAVGMSAVGIGRADDTAGASNQGDPEVGEEDDQEAATAAAQQGYLDRLTDSSPAMTTLLHRLLGGSTHTAPALEAGLSGSGSTALGADGHASGALSEGTRSLPYLIGKLIAWYMQHVPSDARIDSDVARKCTTQGCCEPATAACKAQGHAQGQQGGAGATGSAASSDGTSSAQSSSCACDFCVRALSCLTECSAVGHGVRTSTRARLRHAEQQTAIARCLHAHGLLSPQACFLEFGAGKGGLSLTVDRLSPGSRVVLIDRASSGGSAKADKHFRKAGSDFARIKADIADIWLPGVRELHMPRTAAGLDPAATAGGGHPIVNSGDGQGASAAGTTGQSSPGSSQPPTSPSLLPVVSLGKHLCGGATDLTLRALARDLGNSTGAGGVLPGTAVPVLRGIAIATCCHHSCTWETYVGQAWWRDVLHGSAVEFELTRLLCGWAICGDEVGREGKAGQGEEQETKHTVVSVPGLPFELSLPDQSMYPEPRAWLAALPRPSRVLLGRMAKRLIDAGRLQFIRQAFAGQGQGAGTVPTSAAAGSLAGQQGVTASSASPAAGLLASGLLHYVPRTVTLENTLLLAVMA